MVIDTRNVELNENVYINKECKCLFKIEKFEEDGFTNAGDIRFKLMFKGVEVGTKEPVYIHSETFNIGQSSLWRIKQLEVALKAPEVYDINSFIGRYVIANIKQESYVKDGETKSTYKVKSWEYSQHNDKLHPIPEAKQNESDGVAESKVIAEIDEDAIPF